MAVCNDSRPILSNHLSSQHHVTKACAAAWCKSCCIACDVGSSSKESCYASLVKSFNMSCWVADHSWTVDPDVTFPLSACLNPSRDASSGPSLATAWSQCVLWLEHVSQVRVSNPLTCSCDDMARFLLGLLSTARRHYLAAAYKVSIFLA